MNRLCVSVPPRPPFPPDDVCVRGGGWDDAAAGARVANRFDNFLLDRYSILGFRLARTIP